MNLPLVSLAIDNEDAGGANHEVVDVALGARNFAVVEDNRVFAVDLRQRLGELGLSN